MFPVVVLLAATRGRLVVSVVLLAQHLGKMLTAAPVSIRYLHLLRLSVTYNNLEGDNVGRVASAESYRVSIISPNARVATLLWPTSLKKTRSLMFDDHSRQVHWLCRSVGVGTFKKDFFCLTTSLTSGMSAVLMQGHCLRRRPCNKQHMSGRQNFTGSITDSSHHISPDTRRYMRQGWINVEPTSQTVGQH